MNENEVIAQVKNPLSREKLVELAAFSSSTLACGLLMSSTLLSALPENDPRVRAAERRFKRLHRVIDDLQRFVQAFGVEVTPPSPEMLGMKMRDGVPVVLGRIVGADPHNPGYWLMDALCPYCRRSHHHGWGASDKGHRLAHCSRGEEARNASPLRKTGYYIELDEAGRKIVEEAQPKNR